VLIFISNDFATPNTPTAPGPPTIPGQKPAPQAAHLSPPISADAPATVGAVDANRDPTKPISIGPFQRPVEIGAPVRIDEAAPKQGAPPDAVPTQPRFESIADDPNVRPRLSKPASIPPQANGFEQPRSGPAPTVSLIPSAPPAVAPRVPSCVLTGRQLDNFALNDLSGQPWEYRHHTGKLVLLDFWGTWCIPCRQAIPHLNILQATYGRSGLEVVGIAYEEGALQEQIRKVSSVRDRMGINYRLLLGSGSSCPVRTQFAINAFPTLILLDRDNRIIWRAEGLDAYKLQELDTIIQQQLTGR
jgi:thiol-disulfide isomerase/thioredoxin